MARLANLYRAGLQMNWLDWRPGRCAYPRTEWKTVPEAVESRNLRDSGRRCKRMLKEVESITCHWNRDLKKITK